ncbi:MAG: tRNA (adenosine(37)-N6)-threonylcarbamoyltransferase complex dimerization subunit type 1 TsaB [Ignavibacteria bacterium]|nr:tRNA (adenosine(37)-N6)-threonylcarbamoyltransferase complex dimerization subunit type 1 TsaB [Ignavibacteria bacterium]
MKLLGISTAFQTLSLSISDGQNLMSAVSIKESLAYAEKITGLISDIFAELKFELHSLDGIAVNLGPGTFTGLRIGLSTAKGLAFGSELKLYGYTSFEELVSAAIRIKNVSGRVSVLIDSRKDEFYSANYNVSGEKFTLIDSFELVNLHEAIQIGTASDFLIIPEDSKCVEEFGKILKNIVRVRPNSFSGCLLVQTDKWKYLIDNFDYLEPIYLKNFVPKIRK